MIRILNPKEVSQLLQVKLSTIYQWTYQDYIPHCKVGRFVRFSEDEIVKWLRKSQCNWRTTQRFEVEI